MNTQTSHTPRYSSNNPVGMPSYRKPSSLNSARPNPEVCQVPNASDLAHPYKDENDKETTYPTASFETKEEAINFFQDWIADLKSGTPGVVDAVNQAYTEWCKANGSTNQNLLDAYKEAV